MVSAIVNLLLSFITRAKKTHMDFFICRHFTIDVSLHYSYKVPNLALT